MEVQPQQQELAQGVVLALQVKPILPDLNVEVNENLLPIPQLEQAEHMEEADQEEEVDHMLVEQHNLEIQGNLQAPPQEDNFVPMHLQLGFVQLEHDSLADPFFETFTMPKMTQTSPAVDSVRIWAKHFSPNSSKDPMVNIPKEWMNFFTQISPSHYCWAKNFLTSKT